MPTYWQAYQPGKSIQQYYLEAFMQQLEILRQQFAEDRERDRQEFIKETGKLSNRLVVAALILGLAQLIAAFVAMTRDSLFIKWWLGDGQ